MPLTKKDLEQIGEVIDQRQEKLAGMLTREFLNINEQFKRVHQRFSDVDLSIEKLTRRVQNLEVAIIENREQHLQFDKRLEELYGKVDALDQKVDVLDGRMSRVEKELREIKSRIDRLSKEKREEDEHVREEIVRLTERVERLETAVFV